MIPATSLLLEAALELAQLGGRSTLKWFQRPDLGSELKRDGSPVTRADQEAEVLMREWLGRHFPRHGVLGEEGGEVVGAEPIRWIVDPIDGTRTFLHGVPLYGTLVGVEVRGEMEVGVIALPALGEVVAAGRGLGCTWNGRPCRVSGTSQLSDALVVATDEVAVRARLGAEPDWALSEAVALRRTWGDCYGYALVATGRADVAMDAVMALWDNAALLPVIEEAGGRFTSWRGERTIGGGDAVATNGVIHDGMLAALAGR